MSGCDAGMQLGSGGCCVELQLFNILVLWMIIVIMALIYVTKITEIRTSQRHNTGVHLGSGGCAVEMQLLNILVLLMTLVIMTVIMIMW